MKEEEDGQKENVNNEIIMQDDDNIDLDVLWRWRILGNMMNSINNIYILF